MNADAEYASTAFKMGGRHCQATTPPPTLIPTGVRVPRDLRKQRHVHQLAALDDILISRND